MAGNSDGAKKGVKTKRESGFDFAAAGRSGGKKKVQKGLAKVPKRKRKQIAKKGGIARHKTD